MPALAYADRAYVWRVEDLGAWPAPRLFWLLFDTVVIAVRAQGIRVFGMFQGAIVVTVAVVGVHGNVTSIARWE